MPSTLDPAPWLLEWVHARDPRLDRKLFPHSAAKKGYPNSLLPYAVYSQVWFERLSAMNLAGTGVVMVVYQLDVLAATDALATELADLVTGTTAVPGLHGFQGPMTRAGHGDLFVQRGWLARPGSAEEDDPEHAQAAGTFRVSRDYEIVFEELLRG